MAGKKPVSESVAIIGMSCLFPAARDVDAFWENILGKVDAVSDPPDESWDPEIHYDPASSESDRIYCKKGGFLGGLVRFDPIANKVPPNAVGGEPDQWLALQLARDALDDAGYRELEEPIRHRTAVVLGRGATFSSGTALSVQHSLVVAQTMRIIQALHPEYGEAELKELREGLKQNLPPMNPEIMPGLVPNIVSGRIANRLDLMGPNYTIDAACASSLVAVNLAVRDLLTKDADLALAGGSHVWTPMPMLSVFCRLDALSRREQIRPFDKDADGTILGEGLGLLVLKRFSDAVADQDRIYAVIKGVGVASDGRALGVMAPRLEGEELAMRRAYESAGIEPSSVELIEAHGTGTPVGDLTEIQALSRVFGPRSGRLPSVAVGSVKSMISHTVPAAGVAGIIKTALALHHKVLPPTINIDEPNPRFELDKTPFYFNTEPRPWVHGADEPRRAGVSAFGFGGVDAHVVLEEGPAVHRPLPAHRPAWSSEAVIIEAGSLAGLREEVAVLRAFTTAIAGDSIKLEDLAYSINRRLGRIASDQAVRLGIVAGSVPDLDAKLARAAEKLADGNCESVNDRGGIYFSARPLARTGRLAMLYPGEGSQYANMLSDLCLQFPEVIECFDEIDATYRKAGREFVPSDFIFPRVTFSADEKTWVSGQLWDMDVAAAAVLTADEALSLLLEGLGIKADIMVGHSSGEWAALRAAGVFGTDAAMRRRWIAPELLDVYRDTIRLDKVGRAELLALGADRRQVDEIVAESKGRAAVAMDNCPHQVVVAADPQAAQEVIEAAKNRSLVVEKLHFDRQYHTPGFEPYSRRLLSATESLDFRVPAIPVWSCSSVSRFPDDPAGIKRTTCEQWMRPVEFRRTIESLYEQENIRIFVEVGPRGNLTAFVSDIMRGKPVLAVAADDQRKTGIDQLNHMLAALAAQGVALNLQYLYRWRAPAVIDLNAAPKPDPGTGTLLNTQFPEMKISEELALKLRSRGSDRVEGPGDTVTAEVGPGGTVFNEIPTTGPRPAGPGGLDFREGETTEMKGHLMTNGTAANGSSATRPGPYSPATSADPGDVVKEYFRTVQLFLQLQQQVMSDYLGNGASPGISGGAGSFAVPAVPPVSNGLSAYLEELLPGVTGSGAANGVAAPVPAEPPSLEPASAPAPPAVPATPAPLNIAQPESGEPMQQLLIGIVSDRTGYPPEAISLDADLEADLGIDSIKRVEIMGTFRTASGRPDLEIERLTAQRTLRRIVEVAQAGSSGA